MEEGHEPEAGAPVARSRASDLFRDPNVRLGAGIVAFVAVVAIAWVVIGSTSSEPAETFDPAGPVALSASGLETLAGAAGQPIYWAGPEQGYLYELTRTREGNVYIRYLPPGVEVGEKEAQLLVIVTYPYEKAFDALKNVAGGKELDVPGGGIALVDGKSSKSVHLAFPGSDYQVEVYDPSPARSLEVARSGDVRPVQ